MGSLIQDRMAIDRLRLSGLWMLVVGGLLAIVGALSLAGDSRPLRLYLIVVFTVLAIMGIVRLVRARRRRIAFEARHGADAGKQQPIR